MNLHELKNRKHPRNQAIFDEPWMEGAFVIIVDSDYECQDGRNRQCDDYLGIRGHGQDCLHHLEGIQGWYRTDGNSQGTYLCECECHREDEVAVFGAYRSMRAQPMDARYVNATMWGQVEDEANNPFCHGEDDIGHPHYWCHPCRQNNHHWTE
jgi:hypothetical protein